MDIYEYLKSDHQKVLNLFKKFNPATILPKDKAVKILVKELSLHMIAKQATFYKELEKYEKIKNITTHRKNEYKEIIMAMNDVASNKFHHKTRRKKLLYLEKIFQHHAYAEEKKTFPQANKVLSKEEAQKLKEIMHTYKMKLAPATD